MAEDEHASASGFSHTPVRLHRADELLGPAFRSAAEHGRDPVYVDATLGLGGHAEHFLSTYPHLRLVGLDRDPDALSMAKERLAPFGDRVTLIATTYDGIADALTDIGVDAIGSVDGILFDLGVSSMQLDSAARGFAYSIDAPLDMRMDPTTGRTAADILNTATHGEIARILSTYGEERFAGRIASAVVKRREIEPFTTSGPLVELLYASIPAATRRTGGHPAKRTFQALRVAVNEELDSLRDAIAPAVESLTVGGRVVFMSYQSLEDRVVKRELAPFLRSGTPEDLPVELPGSGPELRMLTRGSEKASPDEIDDNPRAAPVRLRAAERISRRSA